MPHVSFHILEISNFLLDNIHRCGYYQSVLIILIKLLFQKAYKGRV